MDNLNLSAKLSLLSMPENHRGNTVRCFDNDLHDAMEFVVSTAITADHNTMKELAIVSFHDTVVSEAFAKPLRLMLLQRANLVYKADNTIKITFDIADIQARDHDIDALASCANSIKNDMQECMTVNFELLVC